MTSTSPQMASILTTLVVRKGPSLDRAYVPTAMWAQVQVSEQCCRILKTRNMTWHEMTHEMTWNDYQIFKLSLTISNIFAFVPHFGDPGMLLNTTFLKRRLSSLECTHCIFSQIGELRWAWNPGGSKAAWLYGVAKSGTGYLITWYLTTWYLITFIEIIHAQLRKWTMNISILIASACWRPFNINR